MVKVPDMVEMLKSGVHFGHKKSKRHPKMDPFIFGVKGEIHVIDLEKTVAHLEKALAFVTETAARGGTILFVGTKKQASELVKKVASDAGMPYVSIRWVGGTLTNFAVIGKLIKKYKKLKEREAAGEFVKHTKKEQLMISREIADLENLIGGIQNMGKLPDAVFIADLKKERTAFRESIRKNIPVIALCDTNVNPEGVAYPIPANDDAVKSLDMIITVVGEAVKEGREQATITATSVATPS